MHKDYLFWNVDTQVDFIKSDGKLPVPEAESIFSNLYSLTRIAENGNIQVVNTCDWHTNETEELSEIPDFINTFPEHCMENTKGAEFVEATSPSQPYVVSYSQKDFIPEDAIQHRNIVIQKDKFDVFSGNPFTEKLLDKLSQNIVVVYGVAENVCVNFAVKGLLDRGKEVWVVSDAIKGLPNIESPINEWVDNGAKIKTLSDLKNEIYSVFKQTNIMGGADLVDGEGNLLKRDIE
jgi:nicotinamidase/pyrazinamidase